MLHVPTDCLSKVNIFTGDQAVNEDAAVRSDRGSMTHWPEPAKDYLQPNLCIPVQKFVL